MATEERHRVLIVDDDAVILRLVQINLRLEGFDVETASYGAEAVEKARARRPDLVILDVMMPGTDGWEVCRQIKEDPGMKDVPVIFLSARGLQDEERQRGYPLGVAGYLTKPFDPAELINRVRQALGGPGFT